MQIQVCYDKAKYFMHNVIVSNRSFIFFCLFHRLDNFICYISDFFLLRRQRNFGNKVPNLCVSIQSFYISVIYSKYACVFTRQKKMPHMPEKAHFMQYKYLISPNRRLAIDWWCSWMWGWPPLIPYKSRA